MKLQCIIFSVTYFISMGRLLLSVFPDRGQIRLCTLQYNQLKTHDGEREHSIIMLNFEQNSK